MLYIYIYYIHIYIYIYIYICIVFSPCWVLIPARYSNSLRATEARQRQQGTLPLRPALFEGRIRALVV